MVLWIASSFLCFLGHGVLVLGELTLLVYVLVTVVCACSTASAVTCLERLSGTSTGCSLRLHGSIAKTSRHATIVRPCTLRLGWDCCITWLVMQLILHCVYSVRCRIVRTKLRVVYCCFRFVLRCCGCVCRLRCGALLE